MSRQSTRTERLRQLEQHLLSAPHGLSAIDLAERLGVDRRTVYRDLDFLSTQDIPLWQDGAHFGIERTRYLATLRFTFQESLALMLAGLLLSRTIDDRNPAVISALRKLSVVMPEAVATHLQRAASRVQGYDTDPQHVSVLAAIAEGWATGRKVKVQYRSPRSGELRPRIISPYALEPTAVGIYVIGHDDWANDLRTFKIERLEQAEVTTDQYTVPADFDPAAYLATGWGIMTSREMFDVVVRFSPAATPRVRERCWHPSQTIDLEPDGGCVLHVHVSEPIEMQPWIRSWGAQAEVLSPDWLRERVADELRRAADRYWLAPGGDTTGLLESAGAYLGHTQRTGPPD